MKKFGKFYLDKEKDIVVDLYQEKDNLSYVISTPNHGTGNLIRNFARLCNREVSEGENGLLVIKGNVPCYIDGENREVYILRLADTKIANIYPDGTIERKAYIPAIAKTLMSQTKNYTLDANKTLVKTYIRREVKFHTDLHTHMNANLSGDVLIALGIYRQLRYPYYYIKKLGLRITERQKKQLEKDRRIAALHFQDSGLKDHYLERRIDDNTFLNFADLILHNLSDASYNIPRIRASLAVMKDGQAVFTNLEKVYLYRYVFTKGVPSEKAIVLKNLERIPDPDIVSCLKQMEEDHMDSLFSYNTLYQDELLWIARTYEKTGILYAEISDTSLVKKDKAPALLEQIHEVMPAVTKRTGVTLRFLAAFRRIPLTIVKDHIDRSNYFQENLQVLKAIAHDPYVAGCDFVGEEMNDILELKPVIREIVGIASEIPSFVLRIHAGENDGLKENVAHSIQCVEESLKPGQTFPHMRLGHGLYTDDLNSEKGKHLIEKLKEHHIILEFQITSNVRLNNLNSLQIHPLKQYLEAGVSCVQGTDGGALYGTDSIDEQLSLERMLDLNSEEMLQMRHAEDTVLARSLQEFQTKKNAFSRQRKGKSIALFYQERIAACSNDFLHVEAGERRYDSLAEFAGKIEELPFDKIPVVVAGGSFSSAGHTVKVRKEESMFLDLLLKEADPEKCFFVIGPSLTGYEKYLLNHNKDKFQVFVFVPSAVTAKERNRLLKADVKIRVAIEPSVMGTYKSFAYEIFKRRQSVILAFDGNSSASNLIQDAKNSRYKSRTFIDMHSHALRSKASSLEGYVTLISDIDQVDEVIRYIDKYYEDLSNPSQQFTHKHK